MEYSIFGTQLFKATKTILVAQTDDSETYLIYVKELNRFIFKKFTFVLHGIEIGIKKEIW